MPEPLELPESDWHTWLAERVDTSLDAATSALGALKDGTSRNTDAVLALWNDLELSVGNAGAAASLFGQVHPEAEVRDLADEREQVISRFTTDLGLDRELYDVIAATDDPGDADPDAARLRARILRDFRRDGVDLDEVGRERLRAIAERLTVLDQDFGRATREDVRSVRLRPEQLDGLPQDYRDEHPADDDGLVTITTDYPDFMPFRTFATDGAARRALTAEFLNRAWPQNDAVLKEMLALRAERAQLLGFASWPDYDAEVKMIGSGAAIMSFLDRLSTAADAAARRDLEVVLARARQDDPSIESLTRADGGFYEELVRREQYSVDAQQIRRYFDFERVRRGLLDTTARLFGVEFVPRADVTVWHEDVTAYDVVVDGGVIGRIYLDLHPREGKFKHAAQFDLVPGVAGRQLPEGVLECNFPRGLMEHGHVVTLFHEFGHLLHHVLAGGQRFARFSGVATEWDFVEAPSQMLEEWAWDAGILRSFATDASGEAIPAELVASMRAAKDFGKGLFIRTQLSYAALAYLLHQHVPDDTTATLRETIERYDLYGYPPDTHMQASFGHLAGYTSAYYTYLWSLVIAKDLFAQFDRDNLLDPTVAHRYRDQVLVPGGSRDAADLVETFLGRPFSFDAFTAWLDEVPVPTVTPRS